VNPGEKEPQIWEKISPTLEQLQHVWRPVLTRCSRNCLYLKYVKITVKIDILEYKLAKWAIQTLVEKIFKDNFPLPNRKFLNVNIPPIDIKDFKGFKITKAGNRIYSNNAEVHLNPRGLEYYWIGTLKIGVDKR